MSTNIYDVGTVVDGWTLATSRGDGSSPWVETWVKHVGPIKHTQIRQQDGFILESKSEDVSSEDVSNWWRRPEGAKSERIWCSGHKQHDPAAPVVGKDNHSENDMALRQNFTFPYSGTDIAASLERRALDLEAQVKPELRIDRETAVLLGYSTDEEYDSLVKSKQANVDRENGRRMDQAALLRREAAPFLKAGKQVFDLDLDDVAHYGLNDIEAPAAAKKTRAPRKSKKTVLNEDGDPVEVFV